MRRQYSYAALAAVLAAGAPTGLLLVRGLLSARPLAALPRVVSEDAPTFAYVTVSTLVVFALFGYVVGRQADALLELSRTDALTGLRNHRGFTERLAEEVARATRYGLPLSLLLVDVDRLKAINDRGGHLAGDAALRLVGDALKDDARQSDLAARVGGDEFALIAPSTGRDEALTLAERVRRLVADRGAATGLSVSIGVGTLDPARATVADLERTADAALYGAKRHGRNQVAASPPVPPERQGSARHPGQ